ncbi:hypothetical protein H4R21_005598, partial [Coemansia helicoidea]
MTPCHYSPVGPRKKPRRMAAGAACGPGGGARRGSGSGSDGSSGSSSSNERRPKRRAPSPGRRESADQDAGPSGLRSVSHLMLEQLKESDALGLLPTDKARMAGCPAGAAQAHQSPVMEMLRLQTQISSLVDQMRNITIHISGAGTGTATASATPQPTSPRTQLDTPATHKWPGADAPWGDGARQSQNRAAEAKLSPLQTAEAGGGQARSTATSPRADSSHQDTSSQPAQAPDVSRDLINHLINVYFEYGHPSETGMYPIEMYRERLCRAQVSEPFLLSTLAVASRYSEDPRVKREPAYLAGYEFFERVTRGRMMDVLERDCVENMLTLNNLAIFAVGLPVANRGWYFSGLALRMATQMSLQKVDAPGRMPGASMMSSSGIESARRAFWTTLLLEALASFASGEPPPITVQDIHVAEPFDDPALLGDDTSGLDLLGSVSDARPPAAAGRAREPPLAGSKGPRPNVCAHIAQLSMLLIRVARLNGNRHPESALFSPEYAALHAEMIAWYQALPDSMQIRA